MPQKQTTTEILTKRQYGDIAQVAQIMGVSRHNATMILRRENSKRHFEALSILEEVITTREKRIAQNSNN